MALVRPSLRLALDPNCRQRRDLARHAGASRSAHDRGMARQRAALAGGDTAVRLPSAVSLHKEWNRWEKGPDGIAWWPEASGRAPQEALCDLERGMRGRWGSRAGRRQGPRVRCRRFQREGRSRHRLRPIGAIHPARWDRPSVTARAVEARTAWGGGRETGSRPAGGWEAGVAPDLTLPTGGLQTHRAFVQV